MNIPILSPAVHDVPVARVEAIDALNFIALLLVATLSPLSAQPDKASDTKVVKQIKSLIFIFIYFNFVLDSILLSDNYCHCDLSNVALVEASIDGKNVNPVRSSKSFTERASLIKSRVV